MEFLVPGVPADEAEQQYSLLAEWSGVRVPPTGERIQSITSGATAWTGPPPRACAWRDQKWCGTKPRAPFSRGPIPPRSGRSLQVTPTWS
jgi:hypothetical protein